MRVTTTHRRTVILYEWVDARGLRGALSGFPMQEDQRARLDELLDRIEELPELTHESIQGRIHNFSKELKKLKIRGRVALRPILVLGPFDKRHELTFLMVAREENKVLLPSSRQVAQAARERLGEIRNDANRRRRYERD